MSPMRVAAEEYLAMRRGLGYKLRPEGRLLGQFVGFLEERGLAHLTVQAALEWAILPRDADPSWWAKRLTVVRVFARHLAVTDERKICCPATGGGGHRICIRPNRSPR
jgi:integrase/recombinase XerD